MIRTDSGELRRYLLGDLADEAAAAVEQNYFARPDMLDRVWAAEYELVDDYVADRLTPDERSRFERHYLSTPEHRARVAVARELRAVAPAAASGRAADRSTASWWDTVRAFSEWPMAWKAASVAALVSLTVGGAWLLRSRQASQTTATSAAPSREQAPARSDRRAQPAGRSPVVVAVSISPITVRGSDDPATLAIAPGTDLVVLRLEGEANAAPLDRGRAVVRKVSGTEVWRGPAASESDARPGAFAQLQIAASALPPDDYIVELFGTDPNGRETATFRYFLRVRAQ